MQLFVLLRNCGLVLTLSCITSQNGQTHFKNLAAFGSCNIKGLNVLIIDFVVSRDIEKEMLHRYAMSLLTKADGLQRK